MPKKGYKNVWRLFPEKKKQKQNTASMSLFPVAVVEAKQQPTMFCLKILFLLTRVSEI